MGYTPEEVEVMRESTVTIEEVELDNHIEVPRTLILIRECESNHIYTGQDGDLSNRPPRSTASGAYRFLDSTWVWVWRDLLGESPPTSRAKEASPYDQDKAAVALYDNGRGAFHWDASRNCWG